MSLRPELFRALADARGLPSGEEDWAAWQEAYEAVEDALAPRASRKIPNSQSQIRNSSR